MGMSFEELDDVTRRYMLDEFDKEEAGSNPFRGKGLSTVGSAAFPDLMRNAVRTGNEATLIASLLKPIHWLAMETYIRNGIRRERNINIRQASERLGLTEFNTCYVHGLAKKLMDEGVVHCQAYRAGEPRWAVPNECSQHEGQNFLVEEIYKGHRAKYWPEPGTPSAVSIPFGPSCHHTIRRVS
jgi:hypothetical protein